MASNPYDDMSVTGLGGGAQSANPYSEMDITGSSRVKANVITSMGTNPDVVARQKRLAEYVGYSPAIGNAIPEQVAQMAAIKEVSTNAATSPVLQKRYTDAEFMALGHDDSGALSAIASAAKYLASAPGASSTLGGDIASAYHGSKSAAAAVFGGILNTTLLSKYSPGLMYLADQEAAKAKASAGKSETWLGGAVSSGVQSTVQFLPGIGLALLPGGQVPALMYAGAMAGGNTYQKDMADNRGHWTSLIHSVSDATIEVGTEMGPLRGLVDNIKAGTPLLTTMLKNAWQENKGEQVATALQDLNDWAVNGSNKGQTLLDYVKARPEAAAQTAIAVLVGTGGNVALMTSVQTLADNASGIERRAQQAEQHAGVLEAMQTTMQASKMLERSPATLTSYAQDLVDEGAPNVYLDSAKLVEAGVDLQALAQVMPSLASQLDQVQNGIDLVVPTGEFLAGSLTEAGSVFSQPLIEHARTSENSMSRAEAKVYMQEQGDQLNAEIERVMQERGDDAEFKAGRDQVQAQLLTQLNEVNRFTPAVNQQYATLAANFYAVMAARSGMTVQDFASRYQLGFSGQTQAGAQVLGQASPEGAALAARMASDPAGVRAQYANLPGTDGGRILNTDEARELSPEYRADRSKSANVHEPASQLVKDLYAEKLAGPTPEGRLPLVLFTAGGTGAGKSTSLNNPAGKNAAKKAEIIYDTNMNSLDSAVQKIEQALAANRKVGIVYTYRDPVEALTQGALPRAMRMGRTVPLIEHTRTHVGASKVMRELQARYAGNPDVQIIVFDNSRGKNQGVVASLDAVPEVDENGLTESLYASLQAEHAAGRIDDAVYGGTAAASLQSEGNDGRDQQGIAGQPQPQRDGGSTSGPEGQNRQNRLNRLKQDQRGQIAFANDITQQASIISMFKAADLSTFIHEGGHFFLEVQADLAAKISARISQGETVTDGEQSIVDDFNTTLTWMGVKGSPELSSIDTWYLMTADEKRPHHEQWARGFEAYAFEGKSPSIELTTMFQTFRSWLVNVYRSVLKSVNAGPTDIANAMNVELSDEVRAVMDRMLASTEQIQASEAARNMGPLFTSAEEAGMDLEAYQAYHEMGTKATLDAIDELQAKGLKDMQWLSRARSRALKTLQKRHNALRAEIARKVRAEVMSQPIYRAWTFLTAKAGDQLKGDKPVGAAKGVNPAVDNIFTAIAKLGGLNRAEVKSQWGIDEKEKLESGVFGSPVVRKEGGRSMDAMAEYLVEEGYIIEGRNDQTAAEQLAELFDDQRRGTDRYSITHDMQAAYGDQPLDIPELPEMGFGKLRTEDLRNAYGIKDDAIWRKLSELRMTSDETGLNPEIVAELFEFGSADELVRKLLAAEPPKSAIEGRTDQRMLEEHGDLATPAGLERAADMAIHNDARVRAVATELRALQHAMAVREKKPGQKNTVDVLVAAAKEYGNTVISRLKVRDVRPAQYAAAEVRAAKAAVAARGDLAKQAEHKRNQLVNLYATKAAYAAQEEVKKAITYFKKFDTASKTLDPQYRMQIEALLERFDLRASTSLKEIDKRKALIAWVAELEEEGLAPEIPDSLLQEANRKSFKEMTVEEVRGLRDTIQQIEHLGKLKALLLTAKDNRDFASAVAEIVAGIDEHSKGREANTRTSNTNTGKAIEGMKNFWASHIKVATWARVMDGGKDGGPVWEYLLRTANSAGDTEVVMREKATKELAKLVAPVIAQGPIHSRFGKGTFFPSIGRSLNKEAILAMALNLGNASNMQRLLGGEGWNLQQIQPALDTLSAADWNFVQSVWDHFESYRPLIAAKEMRVYGREPVWIDAQPLIVQTSDGQSLQLRGGYYPVKYDPRASGRAEEHQGAEAAKAQMKGAYTSATTRRSFTKERVDEVNGRPLLLSMDGIYNGVQEVIHDLTWHEWLIDANKLLKNKAIDQAIRGTYGPDVMRQFKKWTEDIAAGDSGINSALEAASAFVRQGVSVSGLGLNVMSALMQPLGITQSIVRIGPKWVGRGIAKAVGSPLETTDTVNEKSEFMRTRALTRLREMAEVRTQVKGQSKVRGAIDSSAYFLMMRCQQLVDVPTWWGAYEKAIAEGNGEDRAVALSDQAVIDSQGSGGTKDLSAIERGGAFGKLFTTFYSFFNTALNLGAGKTMTHTDKSKLAADYLLLYVVPVILGAALKDALTPGDSGDWDDEEHILKKLIGEQISFLLGMVAFARETTGAVQAATGTTQYAGGYGGPAGLRPLGDLVKLGAQVNQGEMDDGLRKAIINTASQLLRLPGAQVNRTINGAEALMDGRTQNPGALLMGYQEPH